MSVTKFENGKPRSRKRVAVYCRVSTDKDDQLDSLENQMKSFQLKIQQNKDWKLVKIYADEGISGTSMKRRVQFLEMIEDSKAGKIDYILCKSISRFARNTVDTLTTVRELQRFGVQVFFEKENIDTANSISEMLLTIMASFAQEESRSISENVKWGIRKRFEEGKEKKVPLYGFYHTEDELFLVRDDEAEIVREIFERYVQGETPTEIMNDMIARGVKPPSGDCWKRLQFDRMLKNEKYVGDSLLQKTYVESHLTHRQIRNRDETLPQFLVKDGHCAIVDRHVFDQAQKIMGMRRFGSGNTTYPYAEMLKCPCCEQPLVHGSLSNFTYKGERIRNGGWGCYGKNGCAKYLIIQNFLDAAVIEAFYEKYGERKERVDFYWLDDTVERIELDKTRVTIHWQDGEATRVKMAISDERFAPSEYADYYNGFLGRIAGGEQKNKYRNLMGMGMEVETGTDRKRMRRKHADNESGRKEGK